MRIHSDILTLDDLCDAVKKLDGVYLHEYSEHNSRTANMAFEVKLAGNSSHRMQSDRDTHSATWDEWGAFIGAIFARDNDAVFGPSRKNAIYNGVAEFDYTTAHRFEDGSGELPADTHKQHRWNYNGYNLECAKCSAKRNYR